MEHHPTITAHHFNKETKLDEEIAPLILSLWSYGINTEFCCQGDDNDDKEFVRFSQVSFTYEKDYLRFKNCTIAFEPLTSFIMMPRSMPRSKKLESVWSMSCSERYDIVNNRRISSRIGVHIYFPRKDIGWITSIWKYISNKKKNPFSRIEIDKNLDYKEKMKIIRNKLNERYC